MRELLLSLSNYVKCTNHAIYSQLGLLDPKYTDLVKISDSDIHIQTTVLCLLYRSVCVSQHPL